MDLKSLRWFHLKSLRWFHLNSDGLNVAKFHGNFNNPRGFSDSVVLELNTDGFELSSDLRSVSAFSVGDHDVLAFSNVVVSSGFPQLCDPSETLFYAELEHKDRCGSRAKCLISCYSTVDEILKKRNPAD